MFSTGVLLVTAFWINALMTALGFGAEVFRIWRRRGGAPVMPLAISAVFLLGLGCVGGVVIATENGAREGLSFLLTSLWTTLWMTALALAGLVTWAWLRSRL